MKPVLCTLFDSNYLTKGLALIRSLQRYHEQFQLYVLPLDDQTAQVIKDIHDNRIYCIPTAEDWFEERREQFRSRTRAEFAWTMTPVVINYVLDACFEPHVAYLDADAFLFSPLDSLYREIEAVTNDVTTLDYTGKVKSLGYDRTLAFELGLKYVDGKTFANIHPTGASVAIIPHRFPKRLEWRVEQNGKFNVNFVYFRNDGVGKTCAWEWLNQCEEWCYQRTERAKDGTLRFGDQGYLDDWKHKYGAHVVKNVGMNCAPWNVENYEYCFDNHLYVIQKEDGRVTRIDRLGFYHFHELTHDVRGNITRRTNHALPQEIIDYVYAPYEITLREVSKELCRTIHS